MSNPRRYQNAHRNKYEGDNKTEASHKISAKELSEHNLSDSQSNYRNSSFEKNRSVDTCIDNQIEEGDFTPGQTSSGRYVSNQDAVNRVQQKVDCLKSSGQKDSSAVYNEKLRKTADSADADMRMFNGMRRDGRST